MTKDHKNLPLADIVEGGFKVNFAKNYTSIVKTAEGAANKKLPWEHPPKRERGLTDPKPRTRKNLRLSDS